MINKRSKIRVEDIEIYSPKIKSELTILLVSDLHLYPKMDRKILTKFKSTIEYIYSKEIPDLILLAGDYVDSNEGIELLKEVITPLKAKNGIAAVLGNHDYYEYPLKDILILPFRKKISRKKVDTKKIIKILKDNNIHLLSNNFITFELNKLNISISGADPFNYENCFYAKNINNKDFNILLSHYPSVALIDKSSEYDLICSGHTHGKLFTLLGKPIIPGTDLDFKNPFGLNYYNNTPLIISKGIGVSKDFPFRFSSYPDIVRISINRK